MILSALESAVQLKKICGEALLSNYGVLTRTLKLGYNNKATSPAAAAPKLITFIAAFPVAALGVGEFAIVVFEVFGQVLLPPLPPPNFA